MPINLITDSQFGGAFEVWLDTEVQECDGICLGSGKTKREAFDDALQSLTEAMSECAQMRLDLGPLGTLTDPEPLPGDEKLPF